ncbi:PfkB family carbohydrate kinase [Xanthomonas sp. NCPPB 1638]|uniref:PfkB family carbohydrate kinase n=1 Tax=Xanthomonas TaxID=338 RepID=UPI00132ECAC7|nr:PfkB family carbohydrate kinase [Xanthomonas cucurbitae]QHG88234.1 nucleoside 2-deoxyribosyltransferase [Xanthomonas cucurbitae]WDM74799.1 nucleoside 2-deoxyribosyltransferase [Xanthomonas cucurbitae]
MKKANAITVVGGVYRELCMHPRWDRFFGSGGRAASALATMDVPVELHTYVDHQAGESFAYEAALTGIDLHSIPIPVTPGFHYTHGLSVPVIYGRHQENSPIRLRALNVLRFGMIEGDAIIQAERAVYDPQNAVDPKSFAANGSTATELALVLNRHEARLFLGRDAEDDEAMARALAEKERATVVVIKRGPRGALVFDRGEISTIPAYLTRRVWKIGSGDNFAAHFASGWLHDGLSAHAAANQASLATAYFCDHGGIYASRDALAEFQRPPISVSPAWCMGDRPTVYLAGPFFNLQQLWLVEQARTALMEMGLKVFSPYHDVGHGSAEDVVEKDLKAIRESALMLALVDGLDAGTIYEIGYARAIDRPVVVYSECESPEDLKMMEGSGCFIADDFVSAIYHTVWEAVRV